MSPPHDPKALADHASTLLGIVPPHEQVELFRAAIEAGCLVAFADLNIDAAEREAIVATVSLLSGGGVSHTDAQTLVDACARRIVEEGSKARIAAVGATLTALGQVDAGLTLAALVADASGGIDSAERRVLEALAAATGASSRRLDLIVGSVGRARG